GPGAHPLPAGPGRAGAESGAVSGAAADGAGGGRDVRRIDAPDEDAAGGPVRPGPPGGGRGAGGGCGGAVRPPPG
ncbi:Anaerobic benzoate catabolism transcriptional regulator, partial [Dysosmobacter welbionis]